MRRSRPDHTHSAPTANRTKEVSERRSARPGFARFAAVCSLTLLLAFQPVYALAGSHPAAAQAPARFGATVAAAFASASTAAGEAYRYAASLFGGAEATPAGNAASEPPPTPTPTPDNSLQEAAVSREVPQFNSGHVRGSIRVFEGKSYSLNNGSTISGDLYTAGTPTLIRTNHGSTYGGTVNDGGASQPSGYKITLNHRSAISGKIRTRANPVALPADIPASVPSPAATATRVVNINTAADAAGVGDWATVLDLNVNAPGLTLNVPPGNYRRFNVNVASRLNLAAGTYNFSDTIFVGPGASLLAARFVVVNVAQTFKIDGGKILLAEGALPGDLRLNVLGAQAEFSHASEVFGLVRAAAAQVHLNHGSRVRGQVVARIIHFNNDSWINGDVSFTPPTDTRPPTIQLNSPAAGATISDATVDVTGTAADTGDFASGVASVFVNGQPANLNAQTGAWSLAGLPLQVGQNTITAHAVDAAGNESAPVAVSVERRPPPDTQAPTVQITSPSDGATVEAAETTVSGTAADTGDYASGLTRVLVNGVQATLDTQTGAWSLAGVALQVGPNTITAHAIDAAGNQSAPANITVNRPAPADTQPPTLNISAPANGTTTIEESIAVSGTANDTGEYASGLAHVFVGSREVPFDPSTGAWSAEGVALQVGQNTITVRAVDAAGNAATQSVTVERRPPPDTQAPSLNVAAPADGTTTDAETVAFNGTVNDPGEYASGVAQVTVNGQPANLDAQTGSWSLAGVALQMGDNAFVVRAVDHANNATTQNLTVRRVPPPDTRAPVVNITSPADNFVSAVEMVTVTGTAVDEGAFPTGVRSVSVNGQPATFDPQTGQWTATVALVEGPNQIRATADDGAPTPNRGEAAINVTRHTPDTRAPVVTINTPAPTAETFDETVTVAGTVLDDGLNATGVRSVTVNDRPAVFDPATGQWSLAGVTLAYGDNRIVVRALDGATPPNEGRAEVTVVRNRIPPPTLRINNPLNGEVLGGSTVTVAGSVASMRPESLTVTVNGQPAAISGGIFTRTLTLADGANTINVVATDLIGQQTQVSVSVVHDVTPPTVSFINVPGSVQPGGSYQITVDAADNVGVEMVEFKVDGVTVGSSQTAPYQFTLNVPTPLRAGNIILLTAVARDLTGTTATATARTQTSGPGGLSGFVFDETTGYALAGVTALLAGQPPATTDESGSYSLVSSAPSGVVRLSKEGFTSVERLYSVNPGEGSALFDARLTPTDANANNVGPNGGTATGDGGRLRLQIPAGSFASERDVRLTSVSPQGLANLLPYGWSPVPGAVIDVRAGDAGHVNFPVPARLSVAQTPAPPAGVTLALARYDETTHGWAVVGAGLLAGADATLEADLPATGQYAFLVPDSGATAPPPAVAGQPLPAGRAADASALDAAQATAVASPRTATYSASARSTINFVAESPSQLPSGVTVEASFDETYRFLSANEPLLVDRPAQDFVLYAFPAATAERPNRLAAFFIAKPTRTEFTITELLGANVHVELRSGRQTRSGVLVDAGGGSVSAGNGGQLVIPSGALTGSQPVYFDDLDPSVANANLPNGYEVVAAFDVELGSTTLSRGGVISTPAPTGDNSRVVLARLVTVGGLRAPQVVARAVEEDDRLVARLTPPAVPEAVQLKGVTTGGRYVFIRVPVAFGYATGRVLQSGSPVSAARVTIDQTPFVDVTSTDGRFVVLGAAGAAANRLGAAATAADATGSASAQLAAQDSVASADITVATTPLAVESVSPAAGAQNMIVTTPVTVTFSKPVAPQSITGSNFTLQTAAGNPVLGSITVLAGGRAAVFTPAATLAGSTTYRVGVGTSVRDVYGKPLAAAFSSTFTTAAVVHTDARLRPERIRINYPDASGVSRVVVPAGAVPDGSTIIAVNASNGSTASTVAGAGGFELALDAQVGDQITLIVRQPDGVEYRVTQGAYRRPDGATSVGGGGGTVASDDGRLVLEVPAGAISGQADIRMEPRAEADITTPRAGEMSPDQMPFGAGVQLRAEGNFTQQKELHLEVAVPQSVQVEEGQRVAFMRQRRITVDGQQVGVWEALTSGKVEGGRFKSMSPPFVGIWFDPAMWEITVFVPRTLRVVHGSVSQARMGQLPEPLAGVELAIADGAGQAGSQVAFSNSIGAFALFTNPVAFAENIQVKASHAGTSVTAVAAPFRNQDPYRFPGLDGIISQYATVIFPDLSDSPDRRPAQLEITATQMRAEGEQLVPIPEGEPNPLRDQGVVPVGTPIRFVVKSTPKVASFKGDVYLADNKIASPNWHTFPQTNQTESGNFELRALDYVVTGEGSYSIRIETLTNSAVPTSKATAEFNFISLHNPNTRGSIPGAPNVISVTPENRATAVEAGSRIHLEFSEPVKNLVGGVTVFVVDTASGLQHDGVITSGGVVVGPTTTNISTIDFEPRVPLEGGKTYEVHVTTGVVDTDNQPLGSEFVSTFKTFAGLVLGGALPDQSYRVATAGQYAITVFNNGANGSQMTIYDVSDPSRPRIEHQGFISQRAIAVAAVEVDPELDPEAVFKVPGTTRTISRLAIVSTHHLPDAERAMNLWIYNLDEPQKPAVVGVVSLSFPSRTTSVPGQLTIHGKRAYVGTASQGGLQVVDLEQAMGEFAREDQAQNGVLTSRHPIVKAVMPNVGFGFDAKVQSAPYGPPPSGNPSPIFALSVIDQLVRGKAAIYNSEALVMPVAYAASNRSEFYTLGLDRSKDGVNSYLSQHGVNLGGPRDDRVLAITKPSDPLAPVIDIRALAGVQMLGQTRDVAVALGSSHLWFFDASNPVAPVQKASRSFEQLGLGDAGPARRMEIEGTTAYVLFASKIGVIDFTDYTRPVRVATISNVGEDLRWISVKDGFIYTLAAAGDRAGLNVSLGRAVSQVLVYGVNVNAPDPDQFCAAPVVLKRGEDRMAQPAGIFFQVFGRQVPRAAEVVIRREHTVAGERQTDVITRIPAEIRPPNPSGDPNAPPSATTEVIIGRATWNSAIAIDRSSVYTVEVLLDKGTKTQFTSRREVIPFTYLISEYQRGFGTSQLPLGQKPGGGEWTEEEKAEEAKKQRGSISYLLGGSANVQLLVNDQNIFANALKPDQPQEDGDPHLRSYGVNIDPVFHKLPEGRYTFVLRATLAGNPSVSEEVEGMLAVAVKAEKVRLPGSPVVNDVNLSDGSLNLSYTDAHIKQRGLSLEVSRHYSQGHASTFGPMGHGWTHNYQITLYQEPDPSVEGKKQWTVQGADGGTMRFREVLKNSLGRIDAEDPHQGQLVPNADGTFDFFTKSRVKYHFPAVVDVNTPAYFNSAYMGNLAYMEDPHRNRLTMTYDAQGRMSRVTDAAGRSLVFTYELASTPFVGVMAPSSATQISCTNRRGFALVRNRFLKTELGKAWRVVRIQGPGGLSLRYDYDPDNNLERVTREGTDAISNAADDLVWEYVYGPAAPANSRTDASHLIKEVRSPNHQVAGIHSRFYTYNFDQFGTPVEAVTLQEGVRNTFTYTFDAGRRVDRVVVKDGRDNDTTYDFDDHAHATKVSGPLGAVTTMTWTAKGQLETQTDPEQMKTTIGYDLHNPASTVVEGGEERVESITVYNSAFSKLESSTDARHFTTRYTIDPNNGNVRAARLPTGSTVELDYYANGDLKTLTDESGLVTSYTYDNYGNPTRVSRETVGGQSVVTTNTFDARSRLRRTESTTGATVVYTYDALDRVIEQQVTDPSGVRDPLTVTRTYLPEGQVLTETQQGANETNSFEYRYDLLDRLRQERATFARAGLLTRTYTYDKNSNLESETDRRGVTRTYAYDALNHWTKTTVTGPFGDEKVVADATGAVDKVGNPRSVRDVHGQVTVLTYDGLHRLRTRKLPNGQIEETRYDANGNVTYFKDRKGRITTSSYDPLNRPSEMIDPAKRTTTYVYDDAARTVKVTQDPQGLVRTTQTDGLGRPLREEVKFEGGEYATSYSYSGRTVSITDPRHVVSTRTLSSFGEPGDESVLGASPAWSEQRRYTAFGGLRSYRDANGRETTFTTDGLGRATAASHPGNFSESFAYDGEGNVLSHTDRRGAARVMTYDNLGRLLTLTVSRGADSVRVEKHAYDDAARTRTSTDARERSTVFKYDSIGRPESVTDARQKVKTFAYNDAENTVTESDFKAATAVRKYDKLDRLVKLTDREGQQTTFDIVDGNGLTRTVTDRRAFKRVEVYDALGRLKSVTADGRALASYEYDGNDNRTAVTDGRLNRTDLTYDALNRVERVNHSSVRTEEYRYDGAGNVLSYSDGFGPAVAMTYDPLGRLASRTDGAGNTTRFRFDGEGLLVEKTEPGGDAFKCSYEYNAVGSLTKVTDPRNGTWAVQYFPDQTIQSITDALGRRVDYDYDVLRRLTTVTQHNAAGNGPAQLVTTYEYDDNGNRTLVRDPKGQQVTLVYDKLDRARDLTVSGATGAGPRSRHYDYDPEGNLTGVTETGERIGARSYSRSYDGRNRLTSATDPFGRSVGYTYDDADNVRTVTDHGGRRAVYEYDRLNRLESASLPGGGTVGYTWKPDGLLEKITYGPRMQRTYAYDGADRLTSVSNALGDAQSESFEYTYDANSNRASETRNFNGAAYRSVDYTYDTLDRVTRAAYTDETVHGLKGEYFDNDDFTEQKLTRIDPNVNFQWPANGQDSPDPSVGGDTFSVRWTGQIKARHSENYTFSLRSDEGARLWIGDQLVVDDWQPHNGTSERSGSIELKAGKKYDLKLELREGTGDAQAVLSWQSNSQTKEVVPQSQLYPPSKALAYEYDAVGNRKSERGRDIQDRPVDHTYTYDDLNRLTVAAGYQGGDVSYDYDGNGNLTSVKQGGEVRSRLEYDAFDQLRRVAAAGDQEVGSYDYDFERRRISRKANGVELQGVYDGARLIGEYTPGGSQANRYDYGTDLVRADLRDEGARWYFSDQLGSVTALSAETAGVAAVTTRYEYGTWGEVIGGGGGANTFGYTGQRLDPETGFMSLGNGERYYSPTIAHFVQQDSWTGQLTATQTLNRYAYGRGNPLRYVDPSGHDGLIADEMRRRAVNPDDGWWKNFFRSFVAGVTYDTVNVGTVGLFGAADVMAQDALQGKPVSFTSAWSRGGYGVTYPQYVKNLGYYTAGVAKGAYNVAVGIPMLAYGLATDPSKTLSAIKQGVGDQILAVVDTVADPRAALDKMAAAGQENVMFGIGEFAGETAATAGVGTLAGRGLGILSRTGVGQAVLRSSIGQGTATIFRGTMSRVGAARGVLHQAERRMMSRAGTFFSEKVAPRLKPGNYDWAGMERTFGAGIKLPEFKRISVGKSGHHVPAVRKAEGRPFEVGRTDKTRPTLHPKGDDPGHAHWRMHHAERHTVGKRQGSFKGSDEELFDAYRAAYEGLDDIRVDVKSPDGTYTLGTDVTPFEAVNLMETWLKEQGLWKPKKK